MKKYRSDEIDKLILILNNDGVISVPTDTVYGLCCKVNSEISYERLVNLKNRPSNKSFPIMCSNINQIRNIASVGDREEKLINNFMPGAVTLVLKKHGNVNNAGFRDTDEVAIRMAPSDVLYKIINEVGPVFMTSANKSGEDVCKNIEQIEKVFPDLDGILLGDVGGTSASTIIDCTGEVLKIQRTGPVTISQINEVLEK